LRAALRIHGTSVKKPDSCWVPWLTPVILSTKEAEIRRIEVGSQPGQNRSRDPISKKPFTKKGAGRVAQGEGPEFKPQYCKNKIK
jgi:hypothetical protein